MSRRDTILIAVLINMGLLVVLFISALKPSSPSDLAREKLASHTKEVVQKLPLSQDEQGIDQIDSILGQYAESSKIKAPLHEIESKETVRGQVEEPKISPPSQRADSVREVIVRSGDVLEKIARHNGCSIEEIMRLNHLTDSRLQIGQILYVPVNPATAPQKKLEEEMPVDAKYYTVKNGDSPWTIAIKNNIKLEQLLRLNGLDEAKAKKIKPGDQLRIR